VAAEAMAAEAAAAAAEAMAAGMAATLATTAGSAAGGGLAEESVAADRGDRCGSRGSWEAREGGDARLMPAQLGLRGGEASHTEMPETSTLGLGLGLG
jgi:hypothetical protein